jgi:hypothetical protein
MKDMLETQSLIKKSGYKNEPIIKEKEYISRNKFMYREILKPTGKVLKRMVQSIFAFPTVINECIKELDEDGCPTGWIDRLSLIGGSLFHIINSITVSKNFVDGDIKKGLIGLIPITTSIISLGYVTGRALYQNAEKKYQDYLKSLPSNETPEGIKMHKFNEGVKISIEGFKKIDEGLEKMVRQI